MSKHLESDRAWHLPPYLEGVKRGIENQLLAAGIMIGRCRPPAQHRTYDGPTASEALESARRQNQENMSQPGEEMPFQLHVPNPYLSMILKALNRGPRLTEQLFVNPNQSESRFLGALVGNRDSPLRVPVRNIVYAPDFVSWEEGLGPNQTKPVDGEPRESRKLIRQYARTGSAPPVEAVEAYVQPNDLVIYSVSEGRHRAAAAIRRGYPYIETECISLCQLTENIVPYEQPPEPSP